MVYVYKQNERTDTVFLFSYIVILLIFFLPFSSSYHIGFYNTHAYMYKQTKHTHTHVKTRQRKRNKTFTIVQEKKKKSQNNTRL